MKYSNKNKGLLYLVSTPIGNLEDITQRALRILKEADIIAAEDTRRTTNLLNHFGIKNHLESYFDFNKEKKTKFLIKQLINGYSVAVVSDAGTPGISDPAFYLVRSAIQNEIGVVPVPGPTAFIAALTVSGLPTNRFVFEGFLPRKKGRDTKIKNLLSEERTIVLYESPHRIFKTFTELQKVLGNRNIAVCRELTKRYEEVYRGNLSEAIDYFKKKTIKGEFVLILEGNKEIK